MHQKRSDQMGSVSLNIRDGTARFCRSSTLCSSLVHLIMLTFVLITNLFALYAFTYSPPPTKNQQGNNNENLLTHQISSILHEMSLSERKLHQMDRGLRPGGLFWLDNIYCADDERKRSMTRLIEKFGYKKLKWVIGESASGAATSQVYLSAVLQEPVRG